MKTIVSDNHCYIAADVVCDYGIFNRSTQVDKWYPNEHSEQEVLNDFVTNLSRWNLILVLNSSSNAMEILNLISKDFHSTDNYRRRLASESENAK